MKTLFNRWLLLFVLLLGMSALACNLPFGGTEEPTPRPTREADDPEAADVPDEPTAAATEEPAAAATAVPATPTAETAAAESSPLSSLFPKSLTVRDTVQEFDTLNSYQMEMTITTRVTKTTQIVHATMLVSTDPPQSQMTISFEGDGLEEMAGMENISVTQIGDTSYMIFPAFGCISMPADEAEDGFANSMDASDFLADIGEAQLVGEETINGIDTLHYTFDETAIQDETTQFNWAQGDVYIAKEGNYVVRLRIEGEGTVGSLGLAMDEEESETNNTTGLMVVQIDLTHINEPVSITMPADCESSGLVDADYPVLGDAYESGSFGGIVTYKTNTSFANAVSFYQESLAAEGWVYQEATSFILEGSTALMYFELNGRSLTVTITEDTGSDAFLVVLFED